MKGQDFNRRSYIYSEIRQINLTGLIEPKQRFCLKILNPTLWISAMYRRNFKPKIFTDITTPVKQSYSPNTGKVSVLDTSFISFNMLSFRTIFPLT
jgi:hypothetical protein